MDQQPKVVVQQTQVLFQLVVVEVHEEVHGFDVFVHMGEQKMWPKAREFVQKCFDVDF